MSRFLSLFWLCILGLQVGLHVLQATPSVPHRKESNLVDFNRNSIGGNPVTLTTSTPAPPRTKRPCYESIPCGWAFYTTNRNRFRPIYHYTKNNLCLCQRGLQCVLTDNRLDRKAYIFHCRNTEASGHMYPFPEL